jgi:hypothetical protein
VSLRAKMLSVSSQCLQVASDASVIPPPPSIPPHTDASQGMPSLVASDHSQEMASVPQTSGAEQGMMQHQSFQALHNETLQQTQAELGVAHHEPGVTDILG